VPKNDEVALRWEELAAAQGNGEALRYLGLRFEEGRGVSADDAKAVSYFMQAAEAGDPIGMCALGGMYAAGKGVARSDRDAYRWFFTATTAGDKKCEPALREAGRRLSQQDREAAERDAHAWAARFSS